MPFKEQQFDLDKIGREEFDVEAAWGALWLILQNSVNCRFGVKTGRAQNPRALL